MKQEAVSIVLGYDPQVAGPGFTVNGVASFDLASAIAFACDVLRHQGAPIPDDIKLPVILAAPALLDELRLLYGQAADACGAVAEFNAMPCESLRAKLPTTVIRLQRRLQKARELLVKLEIAA